MSKLPVSRKNEIVVQRLNDEVLVYDLQIHKAFCLNETAAIVFGACDGQTTFDELKRQYKLTDDLIYLALDELKKQNLISEEYASPFARMNRREVIRKVGFATMIALPVISSLVAPTAAHAQSGAAALDATCAACPSTAPAPGSCLTSGSFSVGCDNTSGSACDSVYAAEISPNRCCNGAASNNYNTANRCCTINCRPPAV